MLTRRFCCALLAVSLWSTTATADIIPPGVWRRPPLLFPEGMPPGMVLVFVPREGRLTSVSRGGGRPLKIYGEGTVYWAWGNQLSKDFDFQADKKNLHPLRLVADWEIPKGEGNLPQIRWFCTIAKDGTGYVMSCVDKKGRQM